ncbi:hypothetical protein MTsDn1_11820 [Alteromonas sp. MTD1]
MHPCQGLVFQCADEVGFGLLSFEVEKFLIPRSASRSLGSLNNEAKVKWYLKQSTDNIKFKTLLKA